MAKVSIIVPSRNEKYLVKTVDDIFAKAVGDIEVIVVVDGPTEYPLPVERPNLIFINKPIAEGLRPAIKDASYVATGKYLLKMDAHNVVSGGFDEVLKKDCEDNWVVVPRFYILNARTWERRSDRYDDYFYLACPWNTYQSYSFKVMPWPSRTKERESIKIDETMAIQASLWFMTAEHFHNRLGDLDAGRWGTWATEQNEIVFKTWLGGGKVMVNKNVWNAHYSRPRRERLKLVPEYSYGEECKIHKRFANYFLNNQWEGQIHDSDWLIERFWPLPTIDTAILREKYRWPTDWHNYYSKHFKK